MGFGAWGKNNQNSLMILTCSSVIKRRKSSCPLQIQFVILNLIITHIQLFIFLYESSHFVLDNETDRYQKEIFLFRVTVIYHWHNFDQNRNILIKATSRRPAVFLPIVLSYIYDVFYRLILKHKFT